MAGAVQETALAPDRAEGGTEEKAVVAVVTFRRADLFFGTWQTTVQYRVSRCETRKTPPKEGKLMLHFSVTHRGRLNQKTPAAKHVAYIMRDDEYGPA